MRLSTITYTLLGLSFVLLLAGCGREEETPSTAVAISSADLILPTQPFDPTPTVRAPGATTAPATIVPTLTSTPTAGPPCTPHTEWPTYTVRAGDTIAGIARKVNSSIDQLAAANCLDDPGLLHVGQIIYVPQSLSPTETPSATATRTPTPTPDASLAQPRIHNFAASATGGRPGPGDAVTLTWEAEGETAVLCAAYAFNAAAECLDVPVQGEETVTLRDRDPVADHWVDYRLEVRHDYLIATETVRVLVKCHNPWFRSGLSEWCPDAKPQETPALAQTFQNGLIIVTHNYAQIFFGDAAPACRGVNGLAGVTADTEDLTPPPGRFPPAPSIAPLWLGDLRGGADIQERLGWATAPAQPFTQQIQCERTPDGAGDCFATSEDGRVYIPDTVTGQPGADGLSIADGTCRWREE